MTDDAISADQPTNRQILERLRELDNTRGLVTDEEYWNSKALLLGLLRD